MSEGAYTISLMVGGRRRATIKDITFSVRHEIIDGVPMDPDRVLGEMELKEIFDDFPVDDLRSFTIRIASVKAVEHVIEDCQIYLHAPGALAKVGLKYRFRAPEGSVSGLIPQSDS